MTTKDVLGRRGEDEAAAHLTQAGVEVLQRNWRGTRGEVDIIGQDGDTVVFVEVKTRSGVGFGHPFDAITPQKLARMRRLAREWCARHDGPVPSIRIDVVAVIDSGDRAEVEHLRGVF